jgi:hypothetical protein
VGYGGLNLFWSLKVLALSENEIDRFQPIFAESYLSVKGADP